MSLKYSCLILALTTILVGHCLIVLLINSVKCDCTTVANTSVLKLKDDLFCGYDKDKMPTNKKKQPISVTFMNIIKHVVWEENQKNSIKINCIIGTSWMNPELKWDPDEYNSVNPIYVSSDEIWKPVIEIIDEDGKKKLLDDAICHVRSSGFIGCAVSLMTKVMCTHTYVRYWPHDELECKMIFSTIPYENNTLSIKHFVITANSINKTSPHWQIKNITVDNIDKFVRNQIVYSTRLNFTFSRFAKGMSTVTILPAIALSAINLITPYIKPTGNERLTLCFVNIIIHLYFLQHTWWITPFTIELPMIYVFVVISFFLGIIGLYIGIFLRSILIKESSMPPLWLIGFSRLIYSKYGRYLNIDKDMDVTVYVNLQTITKEEKTDRLLIKQIIDRFYFITSTVVYFLLSFIVFCMYVSS